MKITTTRGDSDSQLCTERAPLKKDGTKDRGNWMDMSYASICYSRGVPENVAYNALWHLRNTVDGKPETHPSYIELTISRAYGHT